MLNPEEVDLEDLPNGPWIWDRETRTKAQGLLSTVKTASFIVAFITVKSCLETIKPLSIKLQKRDQDIYTAYNSIDKVKESIANLRLNIEEKFSVWLKDSEKIAEHIGTEITRPRITGRQRHRANAESDNTEEYFRRNIAIAFCDFLKTEMAVRFQTDDRKGTTLFELLPVQITQLESADDLVTSLMLWEDDLLTPSSLRAEILLWKRLWEGKNVCDYPESLRECLKTIDEDVFPNVKRLLTVACTLPISSCEAERSFSTLRRTKTYLRNTMGEERLSGLILMNVHHQDLKIDVGEICQLFISKNTRRMFEKCIWNINKA